MVPNTTTNTTTNTTVDRPASDISPAVREMLAKEQKRITVLRIVYVMIAIAVLIYSAIISDIDLRELFEGSSNSAEYANRYFPPDFTDWRFYLADIIETVCMGVWGTLLAAVVAAPLSVLAAENISPPWVVQPVRRIFDISAKTTSLIARMVSK
ncbi:MAG: phosphonate ABC transporter, permease protein PhnE, partial [Cyanobacteria bacterium J06554_3]